MDTGGAPPTLAVLSQMTLRGSCLSLVISTPVTAVAPKPFFLPNFFFFLPHSISQFVVCIIIFFN